MIKRRAHVMAPLTAMTGKLIPFKWTPQCQEAFTETKHLIANGTLLTHPDFNKLFHVHTDASNLQMGGVVSQDKKTNRIFCTKVQCSAKELSNY